MRATLRERLVREALSRGRGWARESEIEMSMGVGVVRSAVWRGGVCIVGPEGTSIRNAWIASANVIEDLSTGVFRGL